MLIYVAHSPIRPTADPRQSPLRQWQIVHTWTDNLSVLDQQQGCPGSIANHRARNQPRIGVALAQNLRVTRHHDALRAGNQMVHTPGVLGRYVHRRAGAVVGRS